MDYVLYVEWTGDTSKTTNAPIEHTSATGFCIYNSAYGGLCAEAAKFADAQNSANNWYKAIAARVNSSFFLLQGSPPVMQSYTDTFNEKFEENLIPSKDLVPPDYPTPI